MPVTKPVKGRPSGPSKGSQVPRIGLSPLLPPTIEVTTKQYVSYLHNYDLYIAQRNKLRSALNDARAARLAKAKKPTPKPPPAKISHEIRAAVGKAILVSPWKEFCGSGTFAKYSAKEKELAKLRWEAVATRRNRRMAAAKASASEAKAKEEAHKQKTTTYAEVAKAGLALRSVQVDKIVEETKALQQRRLKRENTSTATQTKRTRAYVVPSGATLHSVVETETVLGTTATATPVAKDSDRLVNHINQELYAQAAHAPQTVIAVNHADEVFLKAQTELAKLRLTQAQQANETAKANLQKTIITSVGPDPATLYLNNEGYMETIVPRTPTTHIRRCPLCSSVPLDLRYICDQKATRCPNRGKLIGS